MMTYNVGSIKLEVMADGPSTDGWYMLRMKGSSGEILIRVRGNDHEIPENTLNDEEFRAVEFLWADGSLNSHFTDSSYFRETWTF